MNAGGFLMIGKLLAFDHYRSECYAYRFRKDERL